MDTDDKILTTVITALLISVIAIIIGLSLDTWFKHRKIRITEERNRILEETLERIIK